MSRPAVKYSEQRQPDVGDYLQRELARCEKIHTVNPNEDYAVIAALNKAGVLNKGEKVMQWFARTLIGRHQVLSMTKDELKKAVTLADERNANDGGFQPPKAFIEEQLRPAPRQVPMVILT